MRRVAMAAAAVFLAGSAVSAQECRRLAPDAERFRVAIEASRHKEADLRARLKAENAMRYALVLLRQYSALLDDSLTQVDAMETNANLVQEQRCPGWKDAEKMAETALVIKNLKARMKSQRAEVADDIAKIEAAMKKGQRGAVSVTFD